MSRQPNGDECALGNENAVMKELGLLLAKAREAKGWSLQQVADRLKVSRSAVNQWELGITQPHSTNLSAVLELLNIDAAAYMRAVRADSRGSSPNSERSIDATRSQSASLRTGVGQRQGRPGRGRVFGDASGYGPAMGDVEDVPVYGASEIGGGLMTLTESPIEEVDRTLYVAVAFDLYITSDAMAPVYERGDRVRIFPGRPVVAGKDVLLATAEVGKAPTTVALRRLVDITDSHWICKQWNPEKTHKYSRKDYPIAYRVVGRFT